MLFLINMKLFRMPVVFLLILFVIGVLLSLITIYIVKFDSNSLIGKQLRSLFWHYPKLVQRINLNYPGDWRYFYLDPSASPLQINVYTTPGVGADSSLNSWLEEMLGQTTGTNFRVNVGGDVSYQKSGSYTDADLHLIRRRLPFVDSNAPFLNIVYVRSYAENPGYLGIALHRDTVFIFKNTIDEITPDTKLRQLLEESTLMHEWGHLLGLEHINHPGCIMSENVEVYDSRELRETEIPVIHCQTSLVELEMERKRLGL